MTFVEIVCRAISKASRKGGFPPPRTLTAREKYRKSNTTSRCLDTGLLLMSVFFVSSKDQQRSTNSVVVPAFLSFFFLSFLSVAFRQRAHCNTGHGKADKNKNPQLDERRKKTRRCVPVCMHCCQSRSVQPHWKFSLSRLSSLSSLDCLRLSINLLPF